ncbi:MAG: hypothetical protein ABEJ74_02440 [Haloferacaceae archaeon]
MAESGADVEEESGVDAEGEAAVEAEETTESTGADAEDADSASTGAATVEGTGAGQSTGSSGDSVGQPTATVDEKNPGIAAIASLVIPGAGQIYNGQFARGIVWFLGAGFVDLMIVLLATILTVILIGPLFLLLIPLVNVVAAYDAYKQAEKINAGEITV